MGSPVLAVGQDRRHADRPIPSLFLRRRRPAQRVSAGERLRRQPLTDGLLGSRGFFCAADAAGACHFGLADINANRFQGGHLYGCYPRWPLPWRLEIERVDWHTSGELARTRVREVCWGMYLSASLLSRLPTDLLDQFLELETEGERPQAVTRYDSGAAYLTMSADPMDAPFPFPYGPECPAVRNAVWLRQRLREAGML